MIITESGLSFSSKSSSDVKVVVVVLSPVEFNDKGGDKDLGICSSEMDFSEEFSLITRSNFFVFFDFTSIQSSVISDGCGCFGRELFSDVTGFRGVVRRLLSNGGRRRELNLKEKKRKQFVDVV